jgi:glycine oxidase
MARPDVTVMGGGIFGLSVAWACTLRGARVRLVEARAIGSGASGGVLGALAPHVPDAWTPVKAFQRDALLAAGAYWAEIETVSGCSSGFGRVGRVQPLRPEDLSRAEARGEAARDLWQGRAVWEVREAAGLAPMGLSPHSGLVIHDTLSARLHPRRACAAMAAALRAKGAEIVIGQDAPPEPAGAVVWAMGHAGLAALGADVGQEVGRPVKGQALVLRHEARDAPQVFAEGLHIVGHDDGTVAVGSTTEAVFADPAPEDAVAQDLHRRAAAICPALAGAEVVESWAGLRPRARSRAPLLGAWSGRPGQFIANGGFKIGFGLAPEVGRVMADLVLDGRDGIPDGCRLEDNLR